MKVVLKGIVSVQFLKKSCFTGSCGQMNYLLDQGKNEEENVILRATVWNGPYNFLTTTEPKEWKDFSLDLDGLLQTEEWLNEVYKEKFMN